MVSGINCGANMGDDTMYSGTVAAAIEGYLFGIPSIAFSQIDKGWAELDSAAKIAQLVVERYLESREDNRAVLLNVNMPNMPVEALKGIRGTRLGKRNCAESVIREMSPRGFRSIGSEQPASLPMRKRARTFGRPLTVTFP